MPAEQPTADSKLAKNVSKSIDFHKSGGAKKSSGDQNTVQESKALYGFNNQAPEEESVSTHEI